MDFGKCKLFSVFFPFFFAFFYAPDEKNESRHPLDPDGSGAVPLRRSASHRFQDLMFDRGIEPSCVVPREVRRITDAVPPGSGQT